jgi:hypothetical protein
MANLCEPIIELSICDKNIKIAENIQDLTLLVYKGNQRQCNFELPSVAGVISLTDVEILDFATTAHTFKLQLKHADNTPASFQYIDCQGNEMESDIIRVRFIECGELNDVLNEIC